MSGCRLDRPGVELGADAQAPFVASCIDHPDYVERPGTDHRYRWVDMPMSYDEAYAFCSSDAAHLAVVDDEQENRFLRDLATDRMWLGHNDRAVEDDFVAVTGERTAFDDWEGNEPNDNGDDGEDCAELLLDGDGGVRWNDARCSSDRRFICECDPDYRAPPVPACMTDPAYTEFPRGRLYREEADSPVTWDQARASCAADGAHLAVISDEPENLRILEDTDANLLWIGFTDSAAEGVFTWINGAVSDYDAWGPGQPNNNDPDEDCTVLTESDGDWHDYPCSDTMAYICECDPGYTAP